MARATTGSAACVGEELVGPADGLLSAAAGEVAGRAAGGIAAGTSPDSLMDAWQGVQHLDDFAGRVWTIGRFLLQTSHHDLQDGRWQCGTQSLEWFGEIPDLRNQHVAEIPSKKR